MLQQLALPAIPLLLVEASDMVERTLAVSTDPEQLIHLDLLLLDMEMPTMGLQEEIIILLLDMKRLDRNQCWWKYFCWCLNANQTAITGTNNNIIGAYCVNNTNSVLSGTQNCLFGYSIAKTGVNGDYNAYFGSYIKYYAGGSSGLQQIPEVPM